ncbi:MAG: hypothetical protein ACNS62_24255 [Candidatus Cyclobacteriaceae bacterium M3_2C_046]
MALELLVESAEKIKPPSLQSFYEYNSIRDQLVAEMNQEMVAQPGIMAMIGHENLSMMKNNHENHARFMASMILNFDPKVYAETVVWVYKVYQNHGFHLDYWPAQFENWKKLLKTHLNPETQEEIIPLYHWLQEQHDLIAELSHHDTNGDK